MRGSVAGAARWLRASVFEKSGVHARQRKHLDGTRAAILMYHRVLPADEAARLSVEPGMYVTPETFAQHLDWLQASFRVLPLSEIVENLSRKRPVPKGACAITFDDGWRDNHDHAFPALRARKLSAAVFLVVNRIGTPGAFWPDEVVRILATLSSDERATISRKLGLPASRVPLEASLLAHFKGLKQAERDRGLDQLRENTPGDAIHIERELLDWEEVERMANGGIEFESHGLSHAILTGIGLGDAEVELRQSLAALVERGYARAGVFAYPSGAYSNRLQSLVLECGYRSAVTTELGLAESTDPPTGYRRIGIHEDIGRTRAEFHRRVPGSTRVPD